jgi:hypothetical protein
MRGRISRAAIALAVVGAGLVANEVVLGAGSAGAQQVEARPGEVRPDFSDWHFGDVHSHASGDAALDENKRCDTASGLPWGQMSAEECADHVVDLYFDAAEANGLEWLVFTEHGPWLGFDRGTYNRGQAERFLGLIRDAARDAARERGTVATLIGQEVGNAAPPCLPPRGHFGVYYAPALIPQTGFQCNEIGYMEQIEEGGGWGAVNHPESGSDWNCWYTGDDILGTTNCEGGVVDWGDGLRSIIPAPSHDRAFTGIEVVTSNDLPTSHVTTQWDRILQDGLRVGATGGADTHSVGKHTFDVIVGGDRGTYGGVGLHARTYAHVDGSVRPTSSFVPDDRGHPIRSALYNGRTIASNGPLYVPQVAGHFPDDGGAFGGDVPFSGDSITVRVDWPTGTFPTLRDGANRFSPSDADRLDVAHAPESLDVVVGEIGPHGCSTAPSAPCEEYIHRSTYAVTADDLANGFAHIEMPVDASWQNVFLRVGGSKDAVIDGESYDFGALASPIYLERQHGASTDLPSDPACLANTLPRNDDGSTGEVALPFPVNFFGVTHESLFVNNNGNVTFDAPMRTFTPFELTANTPPIIAPFFADVDTRASGSGVTTYGATVRDGRPAFCAYWDDVGYYSQHTDKLNTFRLYIIDRSDQSLGDFDIVFEYGALTWETGDASGGQGGLGGTSAGAGFSSGTGDSDGFFQIPGSLVNGALIDGGPYSLSAGSRDSGGDVGVWRFRIRSGLTTGVHALDGLVTDAADGSPVGGALVQVCASSDESACTLVLANASGEFTASGLAQGTYDLRAFPPATRGNLATGTATSGQVGAGQRPYVEISLPTTTAPDSGLSLSPASVGANGVPSLLAGQPTTLTVEHCPGGSVTYTVTHGDQALAGPGTMTETVAGSYEASLPGFATVGLARVETHATCPDGTTETSTSSIYIDPSGQVVDQDGAPIANAVVTLLRSDSESGPFVEVPDGSPLMSPSNRTNPDATNADGRFGWDVVAGYYKVRAEAHGCASPLDPGVPHVETSVLTIPPPALDLELRLDCTPPTEGALVMAVTAAAVEGAGTTTGNATLTAVCRDEDQVIELGEIVLPVGGQHRVEGLPVGASCEVTLADAPPEFRLYSPSTLVYEVLPTLDVLTEFIGVVGDVADSIPVAVLAADDSDGLAGVVQIDVTCSNGLTSTIALAPGEEAVLDDVSVGDECTLVASSDGGFMVGPSTRTVVVQPGAADDTWFVADREQVQYVVAGPRRPLVATPEVNTATAGSTIPVVYDVADQEGAPVEEPSHFAATRTRSVECGNGIPLSEWQDGSVRPALEANGPGRWHLNLATERAWAGTCRDVQLVFADGQTIMVRLAFRAHPAP